MYSSLFSIRQPSVGKPMRDFNQDDWARVQEKDLMAEARKQSQHQTPIIESESEPRPLSPNPSNG